MLSAAKLVSYITYEGGRPHEVCVTDGRYYTSILKEIYGIVLSNQIMSVYRFGLQVPQASVLVIREVYLTFISRQEK